MCPRLMAAAAQVAGLYEGQGPIHRSSAGGDQGQGSPAQTAGSKAGRGNQNLSPVPADCRHPTPAMPVSTIKEVIQNV